MTTLTPTMVDEHSLFEFASGADVIRANQKDQYYVAVLRARLEAVARRALGSRRLINWSSELETTASFIYLALTTLVGQRTLGEEYCDITYSDNQGRSLPSESNRAGFVLGSTLLPYIILKSWPAVRKKLLPDVQTENRTASWYRMLSKVIDVQQIQTAHLAIFYFTGAYYSIPRRFARLRYIFVRQVEESSERIGYEVLGFLMFLRLCIPLFQSASSVNTHDSDIKVTTSNVDLEDTALMPFLEDEARTCTLCLSLMQGPTATTCGHLFCWNCINEWTRTKVMTIQVPDRLHLR